MHLYKVKETASIAGISVRTLHHYDQMGLLHPSAVTDAGYRLYSDKDLEQLQQILFFRELGFGLEEIADFLDNPGFDRKHALRKHRELLQEKRRRLDALITTVDKTLASLEGDYSMSKKEMFDPFSSEALEKHRQEYAPEVKERWGETDAYKESQERTAKYGKDQWNAIGEQSRAIYTELASLMDRPVRDGEVQAAIGRWHQLINENFYTCSLEMFRGLGQMYTADSRFTKNIDQFGQGLAVFMEKAMNHYCDRMENE